MKQSYKISTIVMVSLATLIFFFSKPVITQNPEYHQFIDQRSFMGIPNAMDVLTNILFLIVGALGVRDVMKKNELTKNSWRLFFIGILLIAPGSAYYHWAPDNFTLVWDRLPMSIGFMALYIAVLAEHVDLKSERFLWWALLIGLVSVLVWAVTTDLRLYFWIQYSAFVTIPMILLLFPSRYSHKGWIGYSLLLYGFAKWAEAKDRMIFAGTCEMLSGHSLKHILAALGLGCLWWMVKARKENKICH